MTISKTMETDHQIVIIKIYRSIKKTNIRYYRNEQVSDNLIIKL